MDDAATTVRRARTRAGLTLRELGRRAATSHSTLAAYEAGRKIPTVDTLDRVVAAAGFRLELGLERVSTDGADPEARGRELLAVLDLAAQFPARHRPELGYPVFGRS